MSRFRTLDNCNITQEQIKANVLQHSQNTVTKVEKYATLAKGISQYQVCESGCAKTSDADVPGPVQTICYDAKMKTWNPKTRLNMPTNNTINKGLTTDVVPEPPILS